MAPSVPFEFNLKIGPGRILERERKARKVTMMGRKGMMRRRMMVGRRMRITTRIGPEKDDSD